jgi:hypothetical protein
LLVVDAGARGRAARRFYLRSSATARFWRFYSPQRPAKSFFPLSFRKSLRRPLVSPPLSWAAPHLERGDDLSDFPLFALTDWRFLSLPRAG